MNVHIFGRDGRVYDIADSLVEFVFTDETGDSVSVRMEKGTADLLRQKLTAIFTEPMIRPCKTCGHSRDSHPTLACVVKVGRPGIPCDCTVYVAQGK